LIKELLKLFHPSRFNTFFIHQKCPILIFIYVCIGFKSYLDHLYFFTCHVSVSWLKFLTDSSYQLCHMFLLSLASAMYLSIQSVQFLFLTSCGADQKWMIILISGSNNNFAFLIKSFLFFTFSICPKDFLCHCLNAVSWKASIPESFIWGWALLF
jgi:hypothetical protein